MVLMVRQTAAPEGYTFAEDWNTFCRLGDTWVADDGLFPVVGPVDYNGESTMRASLAPGVTVASDGLNITFGGLFGGTEEARIAQAPQDPSAETPAPTVTAAGQSSSGQALADTGASQMQVVFGTLAVLVGLAAAGVRWRAL